jgi:Domain of unknown function (DUF4139)/N-terminal domain of unknown function (DUF4140)
MKIKLLFLLFGLCSALALFAQPKPQTVASTIEKVTVFSSGAQISRSAKVNLSSGVTTLLFGGLSPDLEKQSIQVKGLGDLTILSVIHQLNYLREQERREEITRIEGQKEGLNAQRSIEKSMLAVFENEEALLAKNQAVGGVSTGLKTADLREAADFHRSRLTEVLLKQAEIEKKMFRLDSSIQQLNNQLKALNQSKDFATSEILVTVSAPGPTNVAFECSYLVKNAGWFATYDLRVKDVSKPIDLAFKANVFQRSGEDWKDVKLTISNGNPTENGLAPELKPWYLRFGYPQPVFGGFKSQPSALIMSEVSGVVLDDKGEALPGATVMVKGSTIGTITNAEGYYVLKLPTNAQTLVFSYVGYNIKEVPINNKVLNITMSESESNLNEVVVMGRAAGVNITREKRASASPKDKPVEVVETYQSTTINFDIKVPYTIMNNGKVYAVDLKEQSVPALYEYFTVPKLDKDAFLTAKIVDWRELNLFEGEVSLFFEGAFLGKSVLDVRHADDTLQISLGRDKGIVVERKKLKDFSGRNFLSNNKTESRTYEIVVRNNKPQPIIIIVQDQLPISTDKDISVENEEYQQAQLNPDTRILTWQYELPARQERKHVLKYSVKYPKNKALFLE